MWCLAKTCTIFLGIALHWWVLGYDLWSNGLQEHENELETWNWMRKHSTMYYNCTIQATGRQAIDIATQITQPANIESLILALLLLLLLLAICRRLGSFRLTLLGLLLLRLLALLLLASYTLPLPLLLLVLVFLHTFSDRLLMFVRLCGLSLSLLILGFALPPLLLVLLLLLLGLLSIL